MKGSRDQMTPQSKMPASHNNRTRPENKDNLDSRENLELNDFQGGHNKKEVHNGEKNEQNERRGMRPE